MAAVVTIAGTEATFKGGEWVSKDADLAEMLNRTWKLDPPEGYAPNPSKQAADWAVAFAGEGRAKVVSFDATEPQAGIVY